jgi:hypothetical protein
MREAAWTALGYAFLVAWRGRPQEVAAPPRAELS